MPDSTKQTGSVDAAAVGEELKLRIHKLIAGFVDKDEEAAEAEFVHFLSRVQQLVDRKVKMEGTKTDTRDLLGELLFTRLRAGMRTFLASEKPTDELRAAEWVMGALFSVSTLNDFAKAFDKALIQANTGPKDFNFAGRTDFISVEEVLQMLASGKHLGCLSLEKPDNRLDMFLKEGRIVLLDPHHMIRRVMPGTDAMRHRELPEAAVTQVEMARAKTGRPVMLALHDLGHFKKEELREIMKVFGKEVLFDFMREREPYSFYYRKLEALPEFAEQNDLRIGVTSMLLEGSKRLDDWKQMLQVFPDPDAPVEPTKDMYQRMGDVALGVLEIKLLSNINGEITARGLVQVLGLPLHDVYQLLIRLAREGIVVPPGGMQALDELAGSIEESVQMAFAALDANDDKAQRKNALDKAFGDEEKPAQAPRTAAEEARGFLKRGKRQ